MSKRIIQSISAFAVLAAMTSCTSAKIDTNIRPGYTRKIDRVYILLNTSDKAGSAFFENMKPILTQKLKLYGVNSFVHVFNILGLDEKSTIQKEISDFKPTFFLTMTQTSKTTTHWNGGGGSGDSGASFELLLQEEGSDSAVWKASLTTSGVAISTGMSHKSALGNPEQTTQELIVALQRDHLLSQP